MPKFLVEAKYTPDGTRGLLKGSASQRRQAVVDVLTSVGGKLEAFYFSFGSSDAIIIMELPSSEAALSVALAVRASGTIDSTTTPLLTVDEADRAVEHHVNFRPPGA